MAKDFPKTQFAIIDAKVDLPNVQSLLFKEHEGSYVVGAMAAMVSKTGKVGFVGGMDIPLIRKFQCGYEQGAKVDQSEDRGLLEHDGHHVHRLERPDPRR